MTLKKLFLKFDVKSNLNLILAKLNFGTRSVVFGTLEFQIWKALNLTDPTKNTGNYSKAKEDQKKKNKICTLYTLFTIQKCSSYSRRS